MTLSTLLALFTLYPWNIGVSVYQTMGDYSTGESYRSRAVYLAMDRRMKDGFVVGYEDLRIGTDTTTYRQYNVLARDVYWILPELRVGGVVGHLETNLTDDGWLWGAQAEGDLPWLGYAVGYIHSDYQNWQPVFTDLQNTTEITIDQWDLSLSRRLRNHIFRVGLLKQRMDRQRYTLWSGQWTWQPVEALILSAAYASGESRYSVDPYLLLLDNNPDVLERVVNLRAAYRLTPNWTAMVVLSQHHYRRLETTSYQVKYLAVGIQLRM
jgi:hypothetical protein